MSFSPISDPREKSPGAARTCSGAAPRALRGGTHSLPKLRACPGMKGQLRQVPFKHRMENEAQGGGRTDHEAQRNQCGRGPCFWSPRQSRLGKKSGPNRVLLLASAPGSWGTLQAETPAGLGSDKEPEPASSLQPEKPGEYKFSLTFSCGPIHILFLLLFLRALLPLWENPQVFPCLPAFSLPVCVCVGRSPVIDCPF